VQRYEKNKVYYVEFAEFLYLCSIFLYLWYEEDRCLAAIGQTNIMQAMGAPETKTFGALSDTH
jgi:hypothetical protein